MSFADRVVTAWYTPRLTLLAAVLWPLSLVFWIVVAARRKLFDRGILASVRLAVPVVVVGNVTVGGAGNDAARTRAGQRAGRARLSARRCQPRLRRQRHSPAGRDLGR